MRSQWRNTVFLVVFLSFAPHCVSTTDYMVAVTGMNNSQEFRENNLAKDILSPKCKK